MCSNRLYLNDYLKYKYNEYALSSVKTNYSSHWIVKIREFLIDDIYYIR